HLLQNYVFGSAESLGFGANWHGEIAFKNKQKKPAKCFVHQVAIPSETEGTLQYGFAVPAELSGGTAKDVATRINGFIDCAPLAIAVIDEEGFIKHSNLAMRHLIGKPEEETAGWSLVQSLNQEQKLE